MSSITKIVVFSDNRETRGTYISFANLHEATPYFKDKNKTSLQTLMEQKYDLVIIEIMSPVMSEIEFVDQVHGLVQGTPILIVSSFFFDTKDLVFGEKIAGFVMKPFDLDKLITGINPIFERAADVIPETVQAAIKEAKVDQVLYESKKLSVLLEISRSLSSITDFDELLHHIILLAADTLQAERATLFLVDAKKRQLWSRTGIGIEKQEIRIPLDKGIAGEVAMTGQAQIIHDPYSHAKFNKDVDLKTGFTTRNILCLPMKNLRNEVIGVFQILNKKEGTFTNEDLSFLTAMAASTGIAIENALLHDELKRQLVNVKESYDELYIAQNQIMKETRFVTFSEILGTVKDVMDKSSEAEVSLRELRTKYASDPEIKRLADTAYQVFGGMVGKVSNFLNEKKKEMNYR
ncbi:MAG: GAF domain-containing protein [Ignavibacteriales bacterium]|nr:GAF domain-containing protein [Ignavibacteriales bacterium]